MSGPGTREPPVDPPPVDPPPVDRPGSRPDPERGLRGVMSATLVLEFIVVLLGLLFVVRSGEGVSAIEVIVILLLAAGMIAACAVVSRPWGLPFALGLQAVLIGCWLISPPLGIMGVVFSLVWAAILWFRAEYRRRLAAGTLPRPIES